MDKKKLLFVYYQNSKQGGVSKSISNITRELCDLGFKVTILFLIPPFADFYPIDERVVKIYLNSFDNEAYRKINRLNKKPFVRKKLSKLLYYIYDYGVHKMLTEWMSRHHKEYDLVITCWYKLSTSLTYTDAAHKTIAWEHINHRTGGLIFFNLLRKRYAKLGAIVCLTEESKAFYSNFHKDVFKIPNIIGDVFENASIDLRTKENSILLASRLDPEKNVGEFLEIIKAAHLPEGWQVKIAGTGLEAKKLADKKQALQLKNVKFLGSMSSDEMPSLFAKSKIFCMTSLAEGLPTTLIEAMFFSNALIAYDCPTGPSEIVNRRNGYLIPLQNKTEFIDKLQLLVNDENALNNLMQSSKMESEKWKKEKIISDWMKIFNFFSNTIKK